MKDDEKFYRSRMGVGEEDEDGEDKQKSINVLEINFAE